MVVNDELYFLAVGHRHDKTVPGATFRGQKRRTGRHGALPVAGSACGLSCVHTVPRPVPIMA